MSIFFQDGQKENRKDSILSDGEISDDSLPPPDTSQEPTATQGELVFEEGLSGITLSVDRQEEALLTPDSREEGELESDGEVISEREDVEKEEGEQTDEDPHQKVHSLIAQLWIILLLFCLCYRLWQRRMRIKMTMKVLHESGIFPILFCVLIISINR